MGQNMIKLISPPERLANNLAGSPEEAIGIRLLTLIFDDVDSVVQRYVAGGQPAPEMTAVEDLNIRFGFLNDPDGNLIEIVGLDQPAGGKLANRIQIGLTVGDVEASRVFYREDLGLEELAPQEMATADGAMKYSFLAGETTIKFWGSREGTPRHTGPTTAGYGIRYFTLWVKGGLKALHGAFEARGVPVALPPTPFGTIQIMFVEDPDGNWLEFVSPQVTQ
jgi:catechol 2,3-dioxygenase-like lactoylglutathione lyase family enzyme